MTGKALKIIEWLYNQEKNKIFEIKEKKMGRSIKANNYAWELMSKIAEKLTPPLTKDEVYENMLQNYGTLMTDENDEVIVISSKSELQSSADLHIAYIGKSFLNDDLFYHYRLIKGSSQYDSKEMYKFIEGIKQEAINLGIEVKSKEEIESLIKALEKMEQHVLNPKKYK